MSDIFHLNDRSVLKIYGDDAAKFLQGLITNDIYKATKEQAIFALMLTPQGKYLYDFYIYFYEEAYFIDVKKEVESELVKKLSMYRLRSAVTIEPVASLAVIAHFQWRDDLMFSTPDPRDERLGYRSLVEVSALPESIAKREHYEHKRIELCVIDPSQDMKMGDAFPLQYRMEEMHAIDYEKGCYVGQEVTARTHWRGNVRKSVFVIKSANNDELPLFGNTIEHNGKIVGEICSSANEIGLALLNIEIAKEQPTLTCETVELEVL